MSSSRGSGNRDSCRTLDGRRLSSVKEAQRLAAAIAATPAREAAKLEEQKARLEKLQKEIEAMDDGPRSGSQKRRVDDHAQFVESGRETVENVRNAVAEAMRKRRKKSAATSSSATSAIANAPAPAAIKIASDGPIARPSTSSSTTVSA